MGKSQAGRFEGKVAIVTGAGTGIGRAIAEGIAAEGGTVIATDIRAEQLATLAGPRVTAVVADLTEPGAPGRLVETALAAGGGPIDILVNNAGLGLFKPTRDLEQDEWDRIIAINLTAPFRLAKAVGEVMIAQGSGSIVNTASGAGLSGVPNAAAYVASKHGIVGLTRSLAVDWGCHGIRVNALAPGFTDTPMSAEFKEQAPEQYALRAKRVPLGRAGRVEDQAAMALFLASDAAAYVNGLIAVVDGGTHAMSGGYSPPNRDGAMA